MSLLFFHFLHLMILIDWCQKQTSVINNSKQSNDQTRDESGIAVSASAAETSDASAEKASRVAKQRLEDPEDGWGDERDTKVDNKVDEYKRLKRETAKARQAVNVLTGAEAEKVVLSLLCYCKDHMITEKCLWCA